MRKHIEKHGWTYICAFGCFLMGMHVQWHYLTPVQYDKPGLVKSEPLTTEEMLIMQKEEMESGNYKHWQEVQN